MSERAKATTTNITEIVWMFTEEEIEEIRKHDESQTNCELLKLSSEEAWYLSFDSKHDDNGKPYAFLHVHPQEQDLRLATSTKSWVREGITTWTVHLVLPEAKPGVVTKQMALSKQLDEDTSNWGCNLDISVKQLLSFYDKKKSLGLRFTITSCRSIPSLLSTTKCRLSFFDDPTCADSVFVVHQTKQDPSHIFACKKHIFRGLIVFDSGFAETNSQNKREIGSFAITSDKNIISLAAAKEEFEPFMHSKEDTLRKSKRQRVSSAASKKGKQKQDDGEDDDQPRNESGRKCTVIEVHDSDYHTYRSMIAYLHTQDTPLFYLPSDLLVKVDQLDDPSTANVDTLLTNALEEVVLAAEDHPLWYGVAPCSAHATYRLADRYLLEELTEMSLGFVTRSLTAENVSYELFSPLSLNYEAVQKSILEFFLENWDQVKKTKSFSTVFQKFGSGNLAKGQQLMFTIFDKMKTS